MSEFDPVLPPGCILSMKGLTGRTLIKKGWVRLKFQQGAYQFSRRYRSLEERGGDYRFKSCSSYIYIFVFCTPIVYCVSR